MKAGSVERDTLVTSLLLAGVVLVAAGLSGRMLMGSGIGVGLVVGAFNGFIIKALLDRGAPILATSLLRLAFFTIVALLGARLMGSDIWPIAAGIAIAQLVMVGVGVRQGMKA